MNEVSLSIARYLARRATRKMRTTYPMVAGEIEWGHPNGRGLGNYLYEVLHHCKDHGLPPLTTILVKKGTRYPAEDAMTHIHQALGDIDVEKAQQEVFKFDWSGVFEVSDVENDLSEALEKSSVWLTSFWGWAPESWGCLSFTEEWMRTKFIESTEPGVLVAIYVSGSKSSPPELRQRLVGFYEVSHQRGHIYDFLSPEKREEYEHDPEQQGKWLHALKATRAWKVNLEAPPYVNDVLPGFVNQASGTQIGSRGLPVTEPDHIENLLRIPISEVQIYGNNGSLGSSSQNLGRYLKVSSAVYPPKEPYFVAEPDGPKHLYVMRLICNPNHWLEEGREAAEGSHIIKVGFSKSPASRCRQIQAAYPAGRFGWDILYPNPIPNAAPYPDAKTAIAGEDAMKDYLKEDLRRVLGGEFFLATDEQILQAWKAGAEASCKAQLELNS